MIYDGLDLENRDIFNDLVNTYRAKIALAVEQANKLNESEISYYSPACGNKTFILNEIKYKFTFCSELEKAYRCFLGLCCGEALIPESEAISWNDQTDDYVCEYCNNSFNYKVDKD